VKTFALLSLVAVGAVAPLAHGSARATGLLTGTTQISFGCPGPVREGGNCDPWRAYPHARFSVARRSSTGDPVPGTAVVVTSNGRARFSVRLDAGMYLVTPLPQSNTRGGPRLTVRVLAGAVKALRVRFEGFPKMV